MLPNLGILEEIAAIREEVNKEAGTNIAGIIRKMLKFVKAAENEFGSLENMVAQLKRLSDKK